MSTTLTPEKKGLLFKALATKPLYEVGVDFGLDKHYKTVGGLRSFVYKVYNEVRSNPEAYGVHPETVTTISTIVSSRTATRKGESVLKEKEDGKDFGSFKDLVLIGRKKAYELLNAKMERIGSSKKKLDEVSVSSLAQVFGIVFDKAQMIQGEATENIAMIARISDKISPDEAIQAILRTREANIEDKGKKK